ncbi:MAG: M23 family metallopeptidase [Bacilli bacterium]|nr:M23 family metallopeptidase [Bacilli bacterium]
MKKRKLKGFVLPSIYGLVVFCLFATVYFLNNSLNFTAPELNQNDNSVTVNVDNQENSDIYVVSPVPEKPIIPFTKDGVTISKSFYNFEDDAEKQQNSLIYYENTYMQNTGVLYSSDESFDVLASVDGTVKDVKEDEILGSVVTVEYNSNVTVIYYSLSDVKVTTGMNVKTNDIIGTSGANKLENEKQNCLLFEVYINGNLVNPIDFFEMKLEDLNK